MTPRQIAAITAAKLEHEGHQLTPAALLKLIQPGANGSGR